jgi:hypothetical protein
VHEFADRLKQAGDGAVGFLYYSGHGVVNGTFKLTHVTADRHFETDPPDLAV